MFKALMLQEKDGKVTSAIQGLPDDKLPAGDVLIRVPSRTPNYKDGLWC